MKRFVLGLIALFYVSLTGLHTARADDSSTTDNETKPVKPSAPRITCAITMQHWCIIGGDGIVNMHDDGNNRMWTITSSTPGSSSVIVRESKLCDSPDDFYPKKISETDYMESRKTRHVVTFSLTKDDVCTVLVEYPSGTDDRARKAQYIAQYWLYACADASCSTPLLNIR
jgi:hypothetical protein